jgi:hypothetical protein
MWCAAAVLLGAVYWLTFSNHFDDALDTARWMQSGSVAKMFEFRHLISRHVPFWLWRAALATGAHTSALAFLQLTDFVSAVPAVLLVFAILRKIEIRRLIAFAATFAFATAWAFWMYVGSGRPYSTSVFFAVAAYYVALGTKSEGSEGARVLRAAGAGALALLACLFWLQQATNCIGAGLLVALAPREKSIAQRAAYLFVFSATGILLAAAILISGLAYTGVAHDLQGVRVWIGGSGTQPVGLDATSPMKAAFGQAGGIIYLDGLPYMMNGFLRHDPRLLQIGNLPWQLGKFILACVALLPVYLHAPLAFRRAGTEQRVLLFSFFTPLALNAVFALLWLGSDQQRFLPSLISLVLLGAMAAQYWLTRGHAPRALAAGMIAIVLFIGVVNLFEGVLRDQREFRALAAQMQAAKDYAGERDFVIFFGRDLSVTYHTMLTYYVGPSYLDLNDEAYYKWESPQWRDQLDRAIAAAEQDGGRVFIVDRLALGANPISAAWSEVQRPRPTVKEVAEYLRTRYCLTPAWNIGSLAYWQLAPRTAACASPLDRRAAENTP